ncbi:MAG: Leucyl aminopeptidase [Fibrobacteria bacterium]|jgi:leucyl aminopeptidase|nr:Leucyl aminopeptidase [Fibrobacteria bacterium]
MKIRIEVQGRETPTLPFSVLWSEGRDALGGLNARDKKAWQPAVDALFAQAEKSRGPESDVFRHKENILMAARLPRKGGLDRSERVRLAAGSALEAARARGVARFGIALDRAGAEDVRAAAEGLLYADYDFRAYKTSAGKKAAPEAVLYVKAEDKKAAEAAVAETRVRFAHLKNLRDWVNTPGSDLDPRAFADIAVELAKKHGLAVKVRDEKQLQKEGFLGLWTVGKGSDRPPRMVTLEYRGAASGKNHLCIVGKGVTFDTGGISLKPPASMWEMKCDMAGAATALAALCAIAELKLPLRVSAVLCLAENRPGNAAVLPGDIFKAKGGKTVMVDNTDAEGRLVLSDGLFEAGALKATHVINIATLTGAVVRALGPSMAGLFANDAAFGSAIKKAGAESGEKFWELPLEEEYREWMEDPVADLKNVTNKPEAGAITAGLFLSEFVPAGVKWSHWDVAGTAFTTSNWKYFKPGATGFGLKTLVTLARELGES